MGMAGVMAAVTMTVAAAALAAVAAVIMTVAAAAAVMVAAGKHLQLVVIRGPCTSGE
jgi:hypothetical protein